MDIQNQPIQKVLQKTINALNKSVVVVEKGQLQENKPSDKPKKSCKKKSKRCYFPGCRKKLKLTDMECRCKHIFCSIHRLPEQHKCSYDFKKFDKECFAKQVGLGGGEVPKMEKI